MNNLLILPTVVYIVIPFYSEPHLSFSVSRPQITQSAVPERGKHPAFIMIKLKYDWVCVPLPPFHATK